MKVNRRKKFQKLSRKKLEKKYLFVEGNIVSLGFFVCLVFF